MFSDLTASREFAWRIFVRDTSSEYRQSLLGYLWAFLSPLMTTVLWVFLNSHGILNVGDTGVPYPVYVMTGTILWQGLVDTMKMPLGKIVDSKAMLTKVNFPREGLILAGVYQIMFRMAFRIVLLIAVFIWFRVSVPLTILLAPLGMIMMMLFGLMVGMIITPLGVLYKDVERTLAVLTSLWFFVTPVIYPAPTHWPASLLVRVNPVSPLLMTTRELMTSGTVSQSVGFLLVSVMTMCLLFAAWVFYRLAMPHLIERMSA
jgi:lipopolysaccharide transport system permease protein